MHDYACNKCPRQMGGPIKCQVVIFKVLSASYFLRKFSANWFFFLLKPTYFSRKCAKKCTAQCIFYVVIFFFLLILFFLSLFYLINFLFFFWNVLDLKDVALPGTKIRHCYFLSVPGCTCKISGWKVVVITTF